MVRARQERGKRLDADARFKNEAIDQLAMANSVCWYGDVLRR